MKLLFISNIPSPYQIEWAKKLRERYDVQFWFMTDIKRSATGRPAYWNVEMPAYCRVLPSRFKKGELCYGPTLKRELDAFNPDVINIGGAWHMLAGYQAYRWALKNNKKTLTLPMEFSSSMFEWAKILRNKFIYNFIYNGIDIFVANGYIHYDYLKMVLGKSNVKIFQNYDDYAPYLAHPVRSHGDTITFMYGGAIDRRMRVPELLRVFERLRANYSQARLIIGGYGPEKAECECMVNDSELLRQSVEFHNVKSWAEIPDVYRRCDVLINYASYSPGAGVVLSAVASGMGIITTISIHASRYLLVDGYNGFMVDADEELYRAMEGYILNPSLLEEQGNINKSIGQCRLTLDAHLEDYTTLLGSQNRD